MVGISVGNVNIEGGAKALEDIIKSAEIGSHDWNEAETRFKFIDSFLMKALGWPDNLIRVEKSFGGEYSDYELGDPPGAVLEAKREGIHFEIPANPNHKLVHSIQSLCKISPELSAAIEQVQGYCSSRGVPIAVVCNGHQLIAFIGSRLDGTPPLRGNAIVVDGYEQWQREFGRIWQFLSPAGLHEKKLEKFLKYGVIGAIPAKPSSWLSQYPAFRYKNDVQDTLRTLAELLIEDVLKTPDLEERFYKFCYCGTDELSKSALVSKNILQARYSALFQPNQSAPTVLNASPPKKSGERSKNEISEEVWTAALTRRPIVLIGSVGVGKTSFVKHLRYVDAKEEFSRSIFIYIDLGSKGVLESDLKSVIVNEIESQLIEKYSIDVMADNFVKGVYFSEIQRFERGIYGYLRDTDENLYRQKLLESLGARLSSKAEHLKESVKHLARARKQQVIISIDNADQRSFEVQQEAFLVAQSLSENWEANVFVSVRPETFHRSKTAGVFAAYPQKVFTISPPSADLVVSKRLRFALNMAEGKVPLEKLRNVHLHLDSIVVLVKVLLDALVQNKEIIELLDNLGGGNIRSVIDIVTKFIGSPNVDAKKIINLYKEYGKYKIPVHEFSKHILLGDYAHFNPESSIAYNVFDVSSVDEREHFLSLMILAYLLSPAEHRDKDGFCECRRVVAEMQQWGFMPDAVEMKLRRICNKNLIEATERITFSIVDGMPSGDMPHSFRITTVGAYHLRRWAGDFSYLDSVLFDTPIFSEDVAKLIRSKVNSFEIDDRLNRAICFRNYITACWDKSELTPSYLDWRGLVLDREDSFKNVDAAVKKLQVRK